jgi:peptidoglycan/xylan/chitin deacetylase (PgdA/CDA1 family)
MRAILMYHSIDDSASVVSTSPATFRRHVEWLASGAIAVVSVETIASLPADADAVALTFDDGMKSVGDVAAPLLADHGLPATVFVVSDAVGGTNRWGGRADPRVPEFPLMSWDELGRVRERGVRVGAHTRSHPRLTPLSDAQLDDELGASRAAIRTRLGATPTTFAYPYGDCDARTARAAARYFDIACTTELRPLGAKDEACLLPRLDAYYLRSPGSLEQWGSRRQRLHLAARAAARRVRNQFSMGNR